MPPFAPSASSATAASAASPASKATSASNASSSAAGGGLSQATSKEMGKDEFLELLVAQLGNQDPMNPMKGQEFAAQLAQFTSVEQLTNISDQIEQQGQDRGALAQSVNSDMAAGLIGRTVETASNKVAWTGEGTATLGMDLQAPATEVTVKIRDAAGNAVGTRTLENVPGGAQEIEWDGTTEGGRRLPAGTYSFDVSATDAGGNPVAAQPYLSGTVERVTFGGGPEQGAMLRVNGTPVPMSQVRSVAAPSPE